MEGKQPMKIAIVHDWFNVSAGGEKVARAMLNSFKDNSYIKESALTADWEKIEVDQVSVFSLIDFLNLTDRQYLLNGRYSNTSFLQYFPLAKKFYRNYLPFFISATDSLNLSRFDIIISSSAAVSKNVQKRKGQIHICYCHTPIRYAWDLEDEYLKHLNPLLRPGKLFIKYVLKQLRKWDLERTDNVDYFIANSHFVAERIKRIYKRDSIVIYPPVDTQSFAISPSPRKSVYVTAGRLVPYKNVDLIAKAFAQMPDKTLYIIGTGPERNKIAKIAGNNITMLGYQPRDRMVKYIQEAKAFILAAEEDFGITTVEAQSCGTPIIAYKKGGYLETVVEGKTGVFFEQQTPESIASAIQYFDQNKELFKPERIRENALQFSERLFNQQFVATVKSIINAHQVAQRS